jgi:hypothetical protein
VSPLPVFIESRFMQVRNIAKIIRARCTKKVKVFVPVENNRGFGSQPEHALILTFFVEGGVP